MGGNQFYLQTALPAVTSICVREINLALSLKKKKVETQNLNDQFFMHKKPHHSCWGGDFSVFFFVCFC